MQARPARPGDAGEIVRLARLLFESMGVDVSDPGWEAAGQRHVRERLDRDLAVFVVDHPEKEGCLVASAAGTALSRLPTPFNPAGLAGYVQWVFTEPDYRGRGLARQVMEGLLAWYDDHGVAAVELHATVPGEPLYRSLGFGDDGPRALRRRRR
jgi:GNAT superfamily N-acetyltransferase